jgi:2',3'-cyclic-nucleotide 2'-phosphodiesterase (5'-nucleotidase family)
VLVDVGDSLYLRPESGVSTADASRARLIMEAMGSMGYSAMAVGERDLGRGVDELKKLGDEFHVTLLAANLIDDNGQHPFGATTVVQTAKGPVGIFAVSRMPSAIAKPGSLSLLEVHTPPPPPSQPSPDGKPLYPLRNEDPIEAARQAVSQLRSQKVVAVIALLHLPILEAQELTAQVSGIDVAMVAHDGRAGALRARPPTYGTGQKGREILKVGFEVGDGPISDASEQTDALNEVKVIDNTFHTYEERAKAAKPEVRQQIESQLEGLRKRREEALAKATRKPDGRLAQNQSLPLDEKVPSDSTWQAKVAEEVARDGRTPGH